MDTTLTAHYSNHFDTWQGRKQSTDTETIAQFVDEYTAREGLPAIMDYITRETDLHDFVAFSLTVDGVEVERFDPRKSGGYARNAEEYAKSWKE